VTTSAWYASLVPVISALLGLVAGLLSPLVTGGMGRRDRRRTDQCARCDEILAMFRDVNVIDVLRDPRNGTRRGLLLAAVRIHDERARTACTALVEYCSRGDATNEEILNRWTTMVDHVARVYRAAS
jgi:hypothetical protein